MLEKEVNIDFCRSMNDIILKELLHNDQRRYDFVAVPDEVVVVPPLRACVEVPKYDFDKQYDDFAFHSLLTREESIQGVNKVGAQFKNLQWQRNTCTCLG